MSQSTSTVTTAIWQESGDHPFQAERALCHGYDLHKTLMPRLSWTQMLLLLFTGQQPRPLHARLLNTLAVGLANPGPRDASVHAAMAAGNTGAPLSAALMAALSVGAGRSGGAREVFDCMRLWQQCGPHLHAWREGLTPRAVDRLWPAVAHPAGFDPVGVAAGLLAVKTLALLVEQAGPSAPALAWLHTHRVELEGMAAGALSHTMVAATAFSDMGLNAEQGEALYLLLRLPGAAAHALEQAHKSYRDFPFPKIELVEPGEAL